MKIQTPALQSYQKSQLQGFHLVTEKFKDIKNATFEKLQGISGQTFLESAKENKALLGAAAASSLAGLYAIHSITQKSPITPSQGQFVCGTDENSKPLSLNQTDFPVPQDTSYSMAAGILVFLVGVVGVFAARYFICHKPNQNQGNLTPQREVLAPFEEQPGPRTYDRAEHSSGHEEKHFDPKNSLQYKKTMSIEESTLSSDALILKGLLQQIFNRLSTTQTIDEKLTLILGEFMKFGDWQKIDEPNFQGHKSCIIALHTLTFFDCKSGVNLEFADGEQNLFTSITFNNQNEDSNFKQALGKALEIYQTPSNLNDSNSRARSTLQAGNRNDTRTLLPEVQKCQSSSSSSCYKQKFTETAALNNMLLNIAREYLQKEPQRWKQQIVEYDNLRVPLQRMAIYHYKQEAFDEWKQGVINWTAHWQNGPSGSNLSQVREGESAFRKELQLQRELYDRFESNRSATRSADRPSQEETGGPDLSDIPFTELPLQNGDAIHFKEDESKV